MNAESPVHDRASADGLNVGNQSTEEQGRRPAAWGKVPRYVATMTLRKDALRLFVILSSYAGGVSRLAWPSQDTLARDLGWISSRTGRPDRYRISKALRELLNADVIRKAGRHPHGERAWTTRYLVAPFPVEDAYEGYATSSEVDASNGAEDAYENGPTMRTNRVEDAYALYAQTDQSQQTPEEQRTHARRNEKHEVQEPRPPTPWDNLMTGVA
jgi:hypothetical protein